MYFFIYAIRQLFFMRFSIPIIRKQKIITLYKKLSTAAELFHLRYIIFLPLL